jgi:predicted ATPase
LHKAGQQAREHSASQEAIEFFSQAITLLNTLPDSPEGAQQELDLQTALGSVLVAIRGYGAPEVKQAYDRARVLCQQMGETPRLSQVLWGLGRFYLVRTPLQTCRELGEQLLNLAQKQRDPELFLEAHNALGAALSYLGELSRAQVHLEKGFALYNPQQHRSHALTYGQDPGMVCLSRMTLTLWSLGYPEQALERKRQALALASELGHPFSMAFALLCVTQLHHLRREARATQELAEATISLCTEQGFDFFGAMGVCLRGWALFAQGQAKEGIAQLRQGIDAWKATGAVLYVPYHLATLAEMVSQTGQTETGLAMLADALTTVDRSGERFWEAEIYRLKGELLLKDEGERSVLSAVEGRNAEREGSPEDCFHKAIDIAQSQSGKSLELRATVSLCRLWQSQGKQVEARQTLAEIYNWFTEGFDTVDLQEAKALLEELS